MSISSTTSRNDYTGNSAAHVYAYTFRVIEDSDLLVTVADTTGVETELVLDTDYSVSGVGDSGGGNVTLINSSQSWLTSGELTTGYTISIRRVRPLTQETDIRNQGSFLPETHEDAFDHGVMIAQQHQDEIDRSLKLPETEAGSAAATTLPNADDRASMFLGFDSSGNPIAASAITNGSAATAFAQTVLDDSTGPAAMTTYRNSLASETAPATGDEVFLYDASASTVDKIALSDLFKVGNSFTEDTAPDLTADFLVSYDTSASAVKKVKLNRLGVVGATLGQYAGMINGTISASRSGSAETIAIKTFAGTDPSATDPVYFIFRNATAGTGDYTVLSATAALSVTVSSGSTLGMTNSTPARIWLTVFNDGGTLRLGVVNTQTSTGIYPLRDQVLASSTAEGGAGAADSAGVIYTGTAVSAKAMRVIGYLEYTLATVGTWGTAPSVIQLYSAAVALPGSVIQVQRSQSGAVATGTTVTPSDDTIPQNTEGDQYMSVSITPTSAINRLHVSTLAHCANSAGGYTITLALHQDSTANALAAQQIGDDTASRPQSIYLTHHMTAGTTSATTFKVRLGGSGAGTTTFNGSAGARLLGGVLASSISVEEVMA